jgi:hypothetical protein
MALKEWEIKMVIGMYEEPNCREICIDDYTINIDEATVHKGAQLYIKFTGRFYPESYIRDLLIHARGKVSLRTKEGIIMTRSIKINGDAWVFGTG